MKLLENKHKIHLVDSTGLNVIRIDAQTSNLALTTYVIVNTTDNSAKIHYSVRPWNDNDVFKSLEKQFDDYSNAVNYYNEIVKKHPNHINDITAKVWWKRNYAIRNYYEGKYPSRNFDNKNDIKEVARIELGLKQ